MKLLLYFRGERKAYGAKNCTRVHLFSAEDVRQVGERYIKVEATDPCGLGVATTQTDVFSAWDNSPVLERVLIAPFQDTIPRAYNFDLFTDYIKPYLLMWSYRKFEASDMFTYQGVEFKVVSTQPEVLGRIGNETSIYCGEALHPSSRVGLPSGLPSGMFDEEMPVGIRQLLLSGAHDFEEVVPTRRGLSEVDIAAVERFEWPPPTTPSGRVTRQTQCMICLSEFELDDDCKRLPCNHVFHVGCIDVWLHRCTACPICKINVHKADGNRGDV